VIFKRARALRQQMTLPEVVLWQALCGSRLDALRFRRQHPTGPYILDFYCPAARLAVEIDGLAHDHPDQARRDAGRDAWLREQEVRVLHFRASDVLSDAARDDVLSTILAAAAAPSTAFGGPSPPLRGGGSMRILLTNDDGIDAPRLVAAAARSTAAGDPPPPRRGGGP
jgi:very-short-patch-repair endonuclease